ncbi:Signal transduction histidine-protein kinase BarA [Planktothrix tepida]|uniref:histidine kinase n=2 Tax=Planktothrix TaxID=54304 RepID=A0A1J1LI98_9CYAN|nr:MULTISPECIES: hybrid sensor histidine kinase/response regulator [Planktothrix]CAD5913230.1 Signal transduction histidine-protein kinase BarA [Planktothrix pseudagardhii]CAD5984186.1 Signal transduction histidine-protein kinase BarA [Planktothrix tepida]CUR32211.1 Response regulator receiver sensor signal transduction histidinekinase [Planktothrix tepida PCC 9214]
MSLFIAPPLKSSDRILAVDDSPDNLFLIEAILAEEGYEVVCKSDGSSALASINADPPDLVLLDVMMPGIDGYEVTRRIRTNPHLPFIPILLITAHDHSSVVEGLDAGADDFIRKPVEVDELLARVRSLLRLKHSIDQQMAMSRQREDFVSRLTHDLRTPLVAADRMLHLVLQGALGEISPTIEDAITSMINSNQNLLQMVNTLLEVYRYEAGRKTLTFSSFDLGKIIQEVIQELTPLAQEKELTLKFNPISNCLTDSPIIMGDPLEIRRVVTNLVGNAIKFTDMGAIEIRLDRKKIFLDTQDQPTDGVILEVEDSGVGMSPEDQAIIFERFRQGNNKRAGSGLGLHLVSRIVEAHRGTIHVQSKISQGSLFTVCLPVNPE